MATSDALFWESYMEEERRLGGKGEGLYWLLRNQDIGFKVPDFDGLDLSFSDVSKKQLLLAQIAGMLSGRPYTTSRLPDEIGNELSKRLPRFQSGPIDVRSSSEKEDGEHSFAGVYDSELVENPSFENTSLAVKKVYDSLNSEKAKAYRTDHNVGEDRMAVILQKHIRPDFSGVMFTSNPSFPSDLSIEFCVGRNRVVEASGATHIIDFDKKTGNPIFKSERYPDDNPLFIDKLMKIGRTIEERAGPSDIEFVIKGNDIYLVQKRRITDFSL